MLQPLEDNFLDTCLFFNCNAFARQLLKLAENEFKHLDLSPAHASLLLFVYDCPGVTPKVLSQNLQLNPSTVTRFIDSLVKKDLVTKKNCGKSLAIHPTRKGLALRSPVALAYKNLVFKYSKALGQDSAAALSIGVRDANEKIKNAMVNGPGDN